MTQAFALKTSLVIAAALGLQAAQAAPMAKADYKAGKTHISADYKADKAACASLSGNGRDICVEQAKAKEKIALAELEYGYTAKAGDQTKVLVARADGAYAVAKEKCDDQAGNVKDVCVKEAKAVQTKALVDARMNKQIGEVKKEAAEDKSDADYKVATERCDALAGDPKAACVAEAKMKFGKN